MFFGAILIIWFISILVKTGILFYLIFIIVNLIIIASIVVLLIAGLWVVALGFTENFGWFVIGGLLILCGPLVVNLLRN